MLGELEGPSGKEHWSCAATSSCQGAASPCDHCLQGPNRQQELPWGQLLKFLELSEHVVLHDPSPQHPGGASEGVLGQNVPCAALVVAPGLFGKLMD